MGTPELRLPELTLELRLEDPERLAVELELRLEEPALRDEPEE